jgi:hypothetical protein
MDSVKKYGVVAIAVLIIVVVAAIFFRGCDQTITKKYGGSTSVELKQGERLEMVTWKEDQMWVQTRMREPGESPINHKFREHSKYGMLEGEVTIKEK